jgi:hypothetical protein
MITRRPEQPISRILSPVQVTPKPGNDHSSLDAGYPASHATYPGARAGNPQTLPYLVLHQVGFAELFGHPKNWCALTAPFHPYPAKIPKKQAILARRYAFCCTFLRVSTTPRYGAPGPMVSGLSSGSLSGSSDRLGYSDRSL